MTLRMMKMKVMMSCKREEKRRDVCRIRIIKTTQLGILAYLVEDNHNFNCSLYSHVFLHYLCDSYCFNACCDFVNYEIKSQKSHGEKLC